MRAHTSKPFGTALILATLLVLLWGATLFLAASERQRVIASRERELARLNVAVEEQTLRLFKLAEASVTSMATWIEEHPQAQAAQDPRFIGLVERLRRLSDNVFEIRLIDEQGWAYSVPSADHAPAVSLADRQHFLVQQSPKTRGLFVSDAVFSHVNAKWVVPVSYPALKPDGQVMTVAASIQLERLIPSFERQRYQPGGSITLIKTNGVTLFRVPPVDGAIGKSVAVDPEFTQHLNATDRGQFISQAGLYDKAQRLVSHSRLKAYPAIIAVTLSLDQALLPWRNEMLRVFGALLLVSVASVFFAIRFRRVESSARQRLERSEKRYRSMIEHAPEAIVVYDTASKLIVEANAQAQKLFGCSHQELLSGGILRFYAPIQPDGLPAEHSVDRAIQRLRSEESLVVERLVRSASGKESIFEVRVQDMSEDGRHLERASFYDITERKLAEQVLRDSERRLRALVETSPLPTLVCSAPPESMVMLMNQRFVEVFGYTFDDFRCVRDWWPLAYPDADYRLDVQQRWQSAIDEMERTGAVGIEPICVHVCTKGGAKRYVEIHMTVQGDRSLVVFNDLTDRHANELELDRIAHYDALTGVANRTLLDDHLRHAIAQTQRAGGLLAVCYLDLDGFKPINDKHGHEAGDHLLVEIAQRLRQCLRGGDTVGRLGGDEFVVLLLGLARPDECEAALQRILEAIGQAFQVAGHAVCVSASIGVSLYPPDEGDADTLLRHADQAMYEAKHAGKNRYRLFDPKIEQQAREHRDIVERMQVALQNGELRLHYQPKVDMRLGRVLGVEALVRWQHPQRGLLLPGAFLPHIEASDAISALGDWVIAQALRQSAAWAADGLALSVSVNIAARHLQAPDFVSRLQAHLANYPQLTRAGHLELEVLETTALHDMGHISQIIKDCRALGVSFALDDFGTGYSSLSYLRRLPVDTLKIDQSFVRDMLRDPEDRAIVEGIIGLAETFGRAVVAEGVESVDVGRALLGLGCFQAQGYGIARPMPGQDVAPWARAWPDAVWADARAKESLCDDPTI